MRLLGVSYGSSCKGSFKGSVEVQGLGSSWRFIGSYKWGYATIIITHARGLITPRTTANEPPSRVPGRRTSVRGFLNARGSSYQQWRDRAAWGIRHPSRRS